MPELITQTAKLTPYAKRPRGGSGFVTAYVYEPAPDEPASVLGSLYIVMEALVSGRASEDVTDLIIETFGDRYYNHAGEQPFALARFEEAVKATNHELAAYVDRGNAAWIGKISCVIAVISGDEVHITHTGSAEGLLYRGKASSRITTSEPGRPATPTKTFSVVASGELEAGDRLLLTTPALVHQVPLKKLAGIVSGSRPNAAISELTALIDKTATDRVGAIITEITTPELAAAQLRSEEPAEIKLGAPENALEAAKIASAPLADATVRQSKQAASRLVQFYGWVRPLIRRAGLSGAAVIRRVLNSRHGRWLSLAILVAVLVLTVATLVLHNRSASHDRLFSNYQNVYRQYATAQTLPAEEAQTKLTSVQQQLKSFASSKATIDHELANSNLADGEPTTYDAFVKQVNEKMDALSGLVTMGAQTVANLQTKGQTASLLELAGSRAYVVSLGAKAGITAVNLTTGSTRASSASLAGLTSTVASTTTPAGDGLYLLTSAPALWLYHPDADNLTNQTVSYGSWPAAQAMGAYGANIYLLSDGSVYKYTRAATGFSPRTTYASLSGGPTADATTMAVDGSVYVLGTKSLTEYLSGAVKQTVNLPQPLTSSTHLRSAGNGAVLTAVNQASGRILVWTTNHGQLKFTKQIKINGLKKLQDAVYDVKTGTLYVLADDKLVKLNPDL